MENTRREVVQAGLKLLGTGIILAACAPAQNTTPGRRCRYRPAGDAGLLHPRER